MGDAFVASRRASLVRASAALSIAVPASSDLLPVRAYECRGKRSPDPTPLGMTDIVLNRLHFGFRPPASSAAFASK